MSSGPENRFIQAVHAQLPGAVYRLKNNNPFVGGLPDCWYSGRAGDLWVEYKFTELPKKPKEGWCMDVRKLQNHPLTPLQSQWLSKRFEEGRPVAVIIGTSDGGVFLPNMTWAEPIPYRSVLDALVSKKAIAEVIKHRTLGQ